MLTIYGNTDYGRSQNLRLSSKHKKTQRLKRESEIANGTYRTYEEKLSDAIVEMGLFENHLGEKITKWEADWQLKKGLSVTFSKNDTKKFFNWLDIRLVGYFKDERIFKTDDPEMKYLKIIHLEKGLLIQKAQFDETILENV